MTRFSALRGTAAAALVVAQAFTIAPAFADGQGAVDLVQMRSRAKTAAEQEATAAATAAAAAQAASAAAQAAAAATQATQIAVEARAALLAEREAKAADVARAEQAQRAAKAKAAMPAEAAAFVGDAPTHQGPQQRTQGASKAPTLADAFGATGIRDAGNDRIEIGFWQEPRGLQVLDGAGKPVTTAWDGVEKVLSFPTAERFTVRGDGKAVEVLRAPGVSYQYADDNRAGLVRVFEYGDATYLSFAKPKASISAYDENHQGTGRHRDRFYKFDGVAKRLTVVADGEVIHIDRVPEVRFFQRAKGDV